MKREPEPDMIVGRAKTVLVFPNQAAPVATITAILARWTEAPNTRSVVVFTGTVRFSNDTQEHVRATVLPLAHRICRLLGLAPGGFEISAVNLAAASQLDLGLEISGFSADLPLLLAMLSARLHMPVPQEVMCTGHIASPDGDVRVVRNLPAKLDAARADTSIRRIILPAPDADASLASLAATERAEIVAATARARERQEVTYVRDVAELLARVFPEEAVIVAALAGGYFGRGKGGAADAGPTGRAAAFLAGSPARFYEALASAWMADDAAPARELLQAWMDLHVARERYPRGIGRALLGIVHTLPSSVLYGKLRWPLAPVGSCIALTQHASARDAQDVLELYEAISRPPDRERTASRPHDLPAPPARSEPPSVLESLLAQLEAQHLAATVALPIDTARGSFTVRAAVLEDHDKILHVVTSFYTHLLRRTDSPGARADKSRIASDACALLERAFARDGGVTAAISEAQTGTRGGLRFVLDQMTEQYKRDRTEERVREVILSTLGPLEFPEKIAFLRDFLARFPDAVPPECAGEPPERYAEKYDLIVRAYVDSMEPVKRLLRAL